MNMKLFDIKEIFGLVEEDTSKFSQQFASTIGLNGCLLVIISSFVSWVELGIGSAAEYESILPKLLILSVGSSFIGIFGAALAILFLRSLIVKKFDGRFTFFVYVFLCSFIIPLIFVVRSIIYNTTASYLPLTSGLILSSIGSHLIFLGDFFTARPLKKKKMGEGQNKQFHQKKDQKRKKPHRRTK